MFNTLGAVWPSVDSMIPAILDSMTPAILSAILSAILDSMTPAILSADCNVRSFQFRNISSAQFTYMNITFNCSSKEHVQLRFCEIKSPVF